MTGSRANRSEIPDSLDQIAIEAQVLTAASHNPVLLGVLLRALREMKRDDLTPEQYLDVAAQLNNDVKASFQVPRDDTYTTEFRLH